MSILEQLLEKKKQRLQDGQNKRLFEVINKLDMTDYDEQIAKRHERTVYWLELRKRVFILSKGLCYVCHRQGIQLHHHCYINLGFETEDDVVLLCGHCHQRVHGRL